ncbi:hemagglutinin repeat-containing protein, partial [Conservatibacter flavescens]
NTGRIEAKTQNVHLQSRAEIKQDGSVIARTGEVNAKAQTTLSQRGETIAKGKISYKAADVNTTQSSLIAAGVTTTQTDKGENRQLDRQTQQGSAVDIQADNHAQLAGHNIAAGTLNITAQSVNLDNSQNNAHDIHLQAHSGNIQADNSQLSAVENLRISTPKTLSTQHSQLSATRIQTTQQDLITKGATWKQTGTDDFRLSGKYIQNQGGSFSTAGNFNLNADEVNNSNGQLIAGRNLNIYTTGNFNSTQGTLFSNNALELQTAQLTNTNGLIKSMGNMHIDTGNNNLLNQQTNTNKDTQKGIVTLGNLVINSATLHNTNGFIGSNQNMEINADKLLNDSGKLYAAQHANLRLNNGYYSSLGQLQADSLSLTAPSIEQHHANITVNKQLGVMGNNLISANNSTISANEINMTLAKSLAQSESSIVANQSVHINVRGTLENSNATIASQYANLTIDTNHSTLNNIKGTLFAQQNLQIDSGILNNHDGIIQAKSSAALHTTEFNNQNGVVMANNADVNSDEMNNLNGTVFSHTALNIISNTLNNTMGVIGSQGKMAIDTRGATLNNLQGQIFAHTAKLNTGAINNQQGLLRGDDTLAIDTNGQQLDNRQTQQTNQGIIGLGEVVLNHITQLDNTQGKIATTQNLTVNAQALTNTQGMINVQQQATIQAAQIDNQSGTIWGANTLINATTINNQQNGQTGSLIGATDRLTVTTSQLNNQQTVATGAKPTQGLQAKNIQLNADTLNNQQGGIYATNSAFATIKNQLNNQVGEFLAGQTAHIHSKTDNLVVDNQEGTIEAGQQLNLNAKTLQHEGTIKTQGDAKITLTDSFTLNQAFQVGNNLIFSTQGDFVNNVKQVVGNQASFTANNLTNHANGEISSKHTFINTKTVTNYGLLDGTENIIKTATLNNIGTGRIYGDHLAIQADDLNNLSDGEKSATIAARERLDLGVGTLINRDHSLIFTLGDIAIGGQLNAQNQATGYAKLVDNGSATIEALGNGDIKTQRLFNHDLYLKLGEYHTDEHIIEYAPSNSSTRYALLNKDGGEGTFDLKNNNTSDSNSYFILKDGTRIASRDWTNWNYNRHTVTSTIEYRDPAKILIGGHLSLSGSDLENNASTLSIGKTLLLGDSIFMRNDNNSDLTAGGITLKNIDIQGDINMTDTGRWESFGKEYRRYGMRGRKRWAVYGKGSGSINDIHPTQHFTFNKVLNEIGNEITGTNTTIDSQSNSAPVALKTISTANLPTNEQGNMAIPTVSAVISGQVLANHPENLADGTQPIIKTHLAEVTLPKASLYQINPEAPNGYLVETDSQFTDRKQWLSSDYMFNALRYDHNNVQKRLGDGLYEQRLVNEQINQLTGRRFLDHYHSDFEQYKALMDSGVYYADKFKLIPGVGLTAEQMAELTSDMVWFVNKEVTLPSGKTLTVLTPQVYLVTRNLDVTTQGSLISAREIVGDIHGNITNTGTIAGRDLTALSANNISNNGVVLGNTVNLAAEQTLVNLGGKIQALNSATLIGKQGVEITSQTSSSENRDLFGNAFAHTNIDRQANIDVNGKLTIYSPKDVVLKAANISANVIHVQGNNVELGTVNTANKQHYNANADNYYRLDQTQEVGSSLNAKNDVNIISENHTALRQASVHSDNGTITIGSMNGDVQIQEGRSQERLSSGSKGTTGNIFSKTTTIRKHDHNYDIAQGSVIDGNNVVLHANKGNMTIQGSNVVAKNNLTATANNINIQEAENRIFEQNFEKTKKSGLSGSLKDGVAEVGYRYLRNEQKNTDIQTTLTQSQLIAQNGNITAIAENALMLSSAILGSGQNIHLQGKQVDILAATETQTVDTEQKQKSSGFGLTAVVDPFTQAKARYETRKAEGSTQSAMGKISAYEDAFSKTLMRTVNGIQPYLRASKSSAESHYTATNQVESQFTAGGNLNVIATSGDITTQGGSFTAEGDSLFQASGDVTFGVTTATQSQQATKRASGFEINLMKDTEAATSVYHNKTKGSGDSFQEQGAVLSIGGNSRVIAQTGDANFQGTTLVAQGDNHIFASNDVNITTAQSGQNQWEATRNQGIGEAQISDTERFYGYNRVIENSDGKQVTHSSAQIASLEGDVAIHAGQDFNQKSGQILGKNDVTISAENINITSAHNSMEQSQHSSDLKIGNFARVKSPIIDLINAVDDTRKTMLDDNASDRLKSAELLGLVAQGYTLVSNVGQVMNGNTEPVLLRVESGFGVAHGRTDNSLKTQESVANTINGQHITLQARSGDINIEHADLTSRDNDGNRLANSSVTLDAVKDINLTAGTDFYKQKSSGQNVGVEVGTALSVGAKTGWSVYAKVGYGSNKSSDERTEYQNTFIDTQTLNIKSGGSTTLSGTTALANRINADVGKDLTIESLQDEHHKSSSSVSAGLQIEFGFGTAWDFRLSGSGNRGSSHFEQVGNQSGLFAEEGGYHIQAKNVHLEGGAISSTNPDNSELATNQLTFKDIHNQSRLQAMSASGSAAYGNDTYSGKDITGASPGLPLLNQEHAQSVTKATLTEGNITLNKDTAPIHTSANALGINTDLSKANPQLNGPKDIHKALAEQSKLSDSVGKIASASQSYASQRAKQAAEKGDTEEAKKWQTGGKYKRNLDMATAILTGALAGQSIEAIAAKGASPLVNNAIKQATEDNSEANILAHTLWSAIETHLSGGNALAGAVAGGSAEALAPILAEKLYGKSASELTEAEKQHIVGLSSIAGGILSAATANTGDTSSTVTTLANAALGADTAKSAVENNYLFANEAKEKFDLLHKENRTEAEENRLQELNELDKQRDQALLSACSGNLLSSGCLSSISDANRAMTSYNQNIGNSYIHTFKGLLGNDYKNVEAVLTGKTQDHIEFEKTARIIAQNWDIDVETARDIATYINRGHSVAAAVGGIYSGKTLGNFATKVPDEIDANKKLPVVGQTSGYENQVSTFFSELTQNGIKFTQDQVIAITKTNDGRIVFLEKGNAKAGLEHVLKHKNEFIAKGISESDIPNFLITALNQNNIVGYQGKGNGRPIYELNYNGKTQRVAITVGNNGFIVGANPVSIK